MKGRSNPNIASALTKMAFERPEEVAIYHPTGRSADGRWHYESTTYRELDEESTHIAQGLHEVGIGPGTRAVLMVKPSKEFFALTFGLFKAAVVPVMVDPGMGIKNLKTCLKEAAPQAFIGIPKAHLARLVLGWGKGTVEHYVTVGRRFLWGGYTLDDVRKRGAQAGEFLAPGVSEEDLAAILFTSGSTGVPKGAIYSHGNFLAQVEAIREIYEIEPGEIDLPTFPLFALFDPALGMTTVLPEMDFANPGSVDPRNLVEPIKQFGITNMFGSPAVMEKLGRYGEENKVELKSLRRVISAGAPVPARTLARVQKMLPEGAEIFTPYGATESLPIASIGSAEILGETAQAAEQGAGICVGRPAPRTTIEVIEIVEEPIQEWSDELCLEPGEVGEFVIKGPQVTTGYFGRPEATKSAKIKDGDQVRHRTGDVGYIDEEGRLWFCGRTTHRVDLTDGERLFTIPCEAIFNTHEKVRRTALVGVKRAGEVVPVLCVELLPEFKKVNQKELIGELEEIGEKFEHTKGIKTFLFRESFPVDIRHNSKIFREELTEWAQERI